MRILLIIAIALPQFASDTYWRVQREMPLPTGHATCVKNAIETTEGVDGVIQTKVDKSYSTTFKSYLRQYYFSLRPVWQMDTLNTATAM